MENTLRIEYKQLCELRFFPTKDRKFPCNCNSCSNGRKVGVFHKFKLLTIESNNKNLRFLVSKNGE